MAQGLTDTQWAYIEPLLPELPRRVDGRGRPWRDSREVLNGILWILLNGQRCPIIIHRIRPAIADFNNGAKPVSWTDCWRRWHGIWNGAAKSTWTNVSLMAVSALPKRGRWSRQNQAWQGHGNCRPRWFSFRPMHSKCFAARDPIRPAIDPQLPDPGQA